MVKTSFLIILPAFTSGFILPKQTTLIRTWPNHHSNSFLIELQAKKKKKSKSKGFAKKQQQQPPTSPPSPPTETTSTNEPESTSTIGLTSIEGATTPTPPTPPTTTDDEPYDPLPKVKPDPNLPPDERTEQILRQRYGLKSQAEQQGDISDFRKEKQRAKEVKKQKARLEQYRTMKDEDFDIMKTIPPPLLKTIDIFLKVGVSVVTTLFVAGGIAITVEAWAKTTGESLPQDVDDFIVNVVEPNFTPGLFVLLGFSISLGLFASAQLGSDSSQYSEDP